MCNPQRALEVGLAATDSPCCCAPSGVSANSAIVLSLESLTAPVDNDSDLFTMQVNYERQRSSASQ